jgi:hypothetical protein
MDKRKGVQRAGNQLYETLGAYLNEERERIYAEIHDYPPPIPACDVQFNYLIEKRTLVTQEIRKLRALGTSSEDPADTDPADNPAQKAASVRRLVADSQVLSRTAKEQILERLA